MRLDIDRHLGRILGPFSCREEGDVDRGDLVEGPIVDPQDRGPVRAVQAGVGGRNWHPAHVRGSSCNADSAERNDDDEDSEFSSHDDPLSSDDPHWH